MKHNKNLTSLSQALRKNMTKEERQLWYHYLRNYPIQFRRQVTCGQYILDFYCARAKLAVELDGSQHFEPEKAEKDARRNVYLESLGIYVLRIPNNEIWRNLRGVCQQIDLIALERISQDIRPTTLPFGEGGPRSGG